MTKPQDIGQHESIGTGAEARRQAIAAAAAAGREWILLERETGLGGDPDAFRQEEMHIATGVVVRSGTGFDADGRRVYLTESLFYNRQTGLPLPCGSRTWNVGEFASLEAMKKAVAAAKADVDKRFPGLIKAYRRQRQLSSQA